MEMSMLTQLLPVLQAQTAKPGQVKGKGMPADFAGLLAMLQNMAGTNPEAAVAAVAALQLGDAGENKAVVLPALFASLLPQAAAAEGVGTPAAEEENSESLTAEAAGTAGLAGAVALAVSESGGETEVAAETTVLSVEGSGEAALTVAADANTVSAPETNAAPAPEAEQLQTGGAEKAELLHPPSGKAAEQEAIAPPKGRDAKQADGLPQKAADVARSVRPEQKGSSAERPQPPQPPVAEQPVTPFRAALETPAMQYGRSQISRADVVEQVLEKMVLTTEPEGESTLFVRLRPAVLGEVEIRLRMENGQLTGRIITENVHVKDALEAALGQVRQRLEAQQINVSELTVTVGQDQGSRQGRPFYQAWEQYRGRGDGYTVLESEDVPFRPAGVAAGLLDIRA